MRLGSSGRITSEAEEQGDNEPTLPEETASEDRNGICTLERQQSGKTMSSLSISVHGAWKRRLCAEDAACVALVPFGLARVTLGVKCYRDIMFIMGDNN